MTSEVEERIHRALKSHPLERIENGYRLVHPGAAGVSILRLLPVHEVRDGSQVAAIAEIVAEYNTVGLPPFHATGVQRLNAMAVHGAYHLRNGRLRQMAQFSIYANEPAPHLAAQTILNAFGAQLPIGRSTALATASAAALEQQRAHHAMPRQWPNPLDEQSLQAARIIFQQFGLAASNNAIALWAELPLSGDCPSRSIDPHAETALLQVNLGTPHPVAGAGYLSTISLPLTEAPGNSAEICRRLNAVELEQSDFVPRLGAWGLHGANDLPGYSCFIPCAEPIENLHAAIMWWCIRRAAWLKERFWAAKAGLQLERIPFGKRV
ncbi:MAG: hypothetical protein ACLPV8_14090 [Steroidobacteraceae bacterium]